MIDYSAGNFVQYDNALMTLPLSSVFIKKKNKILSIPT